MLTASVAQIDTAFSCAILGEGEVDFNRNRPWSESGGYTTVYRGVLRYKGLEVALKKPRWGWADSGHDAREAARKEAHVWSSLHHPNILELVGVLKEGEDIYLVSPFASYGSALQFLKQNPDANRIKLIKGITSGLSYLHRQGIIHGDMKADNVLISGNCAPMLSDFGLSRPTGAEMSRSTSQIGTLRHLSPERLAGPTTMSRTKESDVYAYGMTIYEVLSGNLPYHEKNDLGQIVLAICVRNERPPKEPRCSSTGQSYAVLWGLADRCWDPKPEKRVTMLNADSIVAGLAL